MRILATFFTYKLCSPLMRTIKERKDGIEDLWEDPQKKSFFEVYFLFVQSKNISSTFESPCTQHPPFNSFDTAILLSYQGSLKYK